MVDVAWRGLSPVIVDPRVRSWTLRGGGGEGGEGGGGGVSLVNEHSREYLT